jgi:OOP family OmpA-OmpF porin
MRTPSTLRRLCGASLALAAALSARPAAAEGGISLSRFYPAPPGDRLLGVPSPYVAGERVFHAMALVDYAHNPLVADAPDGSDTVGAVVGHQLFLHLAGTFSLVSRIGIDFDVPFALVQAGDNPRSPSGGALPSPSGAEISDIRIGTRVRIYGSYFGPLQIGIGGFLFLPSGSDDEGSFVGDGMVRGLPQLLAGGRTERLVWSAAIGPEFRGAQSYADISQGTMLHIAGGVGFLFGEKRRIQVGPELTFATVLADARAATTNAELLASGKLRLAPGIEAGAGLGLGLTSGVGTPDFRGILMVAYTPELERRPSDKDTDKIVDSADACPDTPGEASDDPRKNGCPRAEAPAPREEEVAPAGDPDSDGDVIPDAVDACPEEGGIASPDPKKNGCPPPPDRDRDGVPDESDACQEVAGVSSNDPAKNGCPPDKDADAVPDAQDACPDVRGVKTSDPATSGCPADTDRDSIADEKDACPRERGKPDKDPAKNGCPTSVRVTNDEIVILQQVQFDTARATIQPASNTLLEEIAQVMKDHPEILKIEVQGHTDNRGEPRFNQKLSETRAAAVVVALMQRGVEPSRLISKGYGSSKPIGNNIYEAGRRANRRVQFKIIQKAAAK